MDRQDVTHPPVRIGRVFLLGLSITFLVPPVVFLGSAVFEGMGAGPAMGALVDQYRADRLNLFMVAVLGVVPFLALCAALWVVRRMAGESVIHPMATGGVLAIAAVLVWAHLSFWPGFLPDRTYPGWPHGLEFVIAPLFFAPVAMALGLVVGWVVHRAGSGGQ